MHKALKIKRVADALAAAGGGWLPLTLKAWRKYVRRIAGPPRRRGAARARFREDGQLTGPGMH